MTTALVPYRDITLAEYGLQRYPWMPTPVFMHLLWCETAFPFEGIAASISKVDLMSVDWWVGAQEVSFGA